MTKKATQVQRYEQWVGSLNVVRDKNGIPTKAEFTKKELKSPTKGMLITAEEVKTLNQGLLDRTQLGQYVDLYLPKTDGEPDWKPIKLNLKEFIDSENEAA